MFDCLIQLDTNFFSVWAKDLFKNVSDLNPVQFQSAASNNWNVIYKAFKTFLERENFQDSYIEELNVDLILEGDKNEFFGFFLILISIMIIKKRYLWNQSLGRIQNSDHYNLLKNLEKTLAVNEEIHEEPKHKLSEADRDESQTLVDMITDLEKKLKTEVEKSTRLKYDLDSKQDEVDEIRKMHEQKTFDMEKMKIRLEALEQSQKEYYDAMAIQKDHAMLVEQLKKLEKREEDLEMENSFLRDKINEQDKRIKELKEIESKYLVDENMRKKFEMVLERNDVLNVDSRKKDLELEGLKYQVELLKKNKEAMENALIVSKNDNMRLEQTVSGFHEELKAKDQDISNLDKIIVKLKENIEVNMLTTQPTLMSPTFKNRSN